MRHLLTILAALFLCSAPLHAQTLKSLMFNATNGQLVAGTNVVWTNAFNFSTNTVANQVRTNLGLGWSALTNTNAANFRSAIGLNQSWLTNTNSPLFPDSNGRLVAPVTIYDAVNDYALLTLPSDASQTVDPIVMNVQSGAWDTSNNRTALGLGVSNTPIFNGVNLVSTNDTTMTNQIFAVSQDLNINRNNVNFVGFSGSPNRIALSVPVSFGASPSSIQAATTRSNLSLGLPALTNTSNVTMMRALSGSTNTNHPYSGTVALTNTNAVLTFSNGILQSVQ